MGLSRCYIAMRLFLFISLCIFAMTSTTAQSSAPRPHFIYVYDPLCGWCYGFSPVMETLWATYRGQATMEVVSGGMMRGSRVGPVSEIAPYIREAYRTVEQRTGVRFGEAYLADLLQEGATIMDSEPGSLAQVVVKALQPEQALAFAASLQKAIYFDGMAPRDGEGMVALATALGVDEAAYREAIASDALYQAMIDDFNRSEGLNVQGFPTLFMELDDRRYVLARGYADWPALQERIAQILREEGQAAGR